MSLPEPTDQVDNVIVSRCYGLAVWSTARGRLIFGVTTVGSRDSVASSG
jgi:hypothetical protein